MNHGDTAWILVSAAFVMLMTPALAFFYGGMVRRKNVLGTVMQSFIVIGVISIEWMFVGYSLAFGPDRGGVIGDLSWFALSGVGSAPFKGYAATIPHQAFMIYQMMFAVITPALISGAFAERFKFSTYLVFTLLWALLVYNPVAHWMWGIGGWLKELGALDFAGGTVVHLTAGVSALAAALVIGKRKGYGHDNLAPHDLPMTVLGAGILWFGWFGFNAGSALAADGLSSSAFVATHMSASAGTVSWMLTEWIHRGKPTVLGAASGCIAGLGTITPASGYVTPPAALAIGLVAGIVCYGAVMLKVRFGYDDSLDVVGVHGVGGILGMLATGLFATIAVNPGGSNGLFYGNPGQLAIQALAVGVILVYSFVMTYGIFKFLDMAMGLRLKEEQEVMGLDLSEHGEAGYN
ncbi:MAG: ammonium transporter [Deltaproteobacteria bacterium]|nr:ammonium transporter [Deltaproteobacteria bacterium]PWB68361.1 MAG: ammonia channel protein [Deltaproteobacteria bacterium]